MGMIIAENWVAGAAVRNQEAGPDFFEPIDDRPWSDRDGFVRGFCTSFRVRPDREVWFHFAIPAPSRLPGAERLFVDRVMPLWSIHGGASLCWATLHIGGIGRLELSEMARTIEPAGEAVSDERGLFAMHRNEFAAWPRPCVTAGLQLALMVRTNSEAGEVRFFGAGAAFAAEED